MCTLISKQMFACELLKPHMAVVCRAGLRMPAVGETLESSRVDIPGLTSPSAGVRQASPGEGAVLEVTQWGSLLLYATQRGGIHAWDLRADTNAWSIPCSPNQVKICHCLTNGLQQAAFM